MKKMLAVLVVAFCALAGKATCDENAPLKLAQTYKLPTDVKGNFDHFAIDLAGNRLFATPEEYKAVLVFDLKNGNLIHKITGIDKPHAILFREDLKRLYVTDGEAGDVKIIDSDNYKVVSSVKLREDADSIGYDSKTKYLYIDNGGGDVHQTYSMLSIVSTTAGKKVADMKVDGDTLEAIANFPQQQSQKPSRCNRSRKAYADCQLAHHPRKNERGYGLRRGQSSPLHCLQQRGDRGDGY